MTTPISRVEAALESLGSEHEPPAGWEARVLAQIRSRPSRRPWWLAIPAIALVVLVIALWPRTAPGILQLTLKVTAAGPIVRGPSAHVGDLVDIAATGGERHRAIWVYRDDELVAVCPHTSPCEVAQDSTHAHFALTAYGTYAFVALGSAQPIPTPRGSYDSDLAAAGDAGATAQVQRIVAM